MQKSLKNLLLITSTSTFNQLIFKAKQRIWDFFHCAFVLLFLMPCACYCAGKKKQSGHPEKNNKSYNDLSSIGFSYEVQSKVHSYSSQKNVAFCRLKHWLSHPMIPMRGMKILLSNSSRWRCFTHLDLWGLKKLCICHRI